MLSYVGRRPLLPRTANTPIRLSTRSSIQYSSNNVFSDSSIKEIQYTTQHHHLLSNTPQTINVTRMSSQFSKRPKKIQSDRGPELLQYISKVHVRFWPAHPRNGAARFRFFSFISNTFQILKRSIFFCFICRHVLSTFRSESAKLTNDRCVVEHNIVNDGSDPLITVEFGNLE